MTDLNFSFTLLRIMVQICSSLSNIYIRRYWLVCSQKLMVGILINVTKLNLLNPFIVKNCSYLFTKAFINTFLLVITL